MHRLGVAAQSVTRLVWYVRRDSVTAVQGGTLSELPFAVGSQADAELHFVHTLSHPDSLLDLDLIAHLDLDDVKDRRPGPEICAPA